MRYWYDEGYYDGLYGLGIHTYGLSWAAYYRYMEGYRSGVRVRMARTRPYYSTYYSGYSRGYRDGYRAGYRDSMYNPYDY